MPSKLIEVIAQHFHEVNYGNNWTDVSVKDTVDRISFREATRQTGNVNTIALLLYHMDFYNMVVYDRLVDAKRAFEHEDSLRVEVMDEKAWENLKTTYFEHVDLIHKAILAFPESRLFETTTTNTPYKNLHGLVEHIHYHLGQISLLRKLVQ